MDNKYKHFYGSISNTISDLLFPIFSIFIVNIVPFLVNDFTTIYV